jgi:hypothetical protein
VLLLMVQVIKKFCELSEPSVVQFKFLGTIYFLFIGGGVFEHPIQNVREAHQQISG